MADPRALNLPGVKDPPNRDIDDFLSKVTDVEAQLKGLRDGTLKPEDVVVPDEDDDTRRRRKMTPEQIAAEEAKKAEERAIAVRLAAERRERDLRKEREAWWEKARFHFGEGGVVREHAEGADAGGKRPDAKELYQRGLDYDKWSSWKPEDPATKEEEAKKEEEVQRLKDAEFEKLNPDFCEQVTDDIKKRKQTNAEKTQAAAKAKDRANALFRKGEYKRAITVYHEALKLREWEVPVMTNLAMAHLKLGELDYAQDHCDRALLVNPRWVKAYFRRALVHEAKSPPDLEAAVADLQRAVDIEPSNGDLARELARVRGAWEEAQFEASVRAKAKAAGASGGEVAVDAAAAAAAAAA
eukprot:CAMPEP_0203811698 /NCGR_PEP_ID=MMETSP0115-20131106/3712_1 /ASSEMBLY_ACC=CAM_ASM_000227 /TAXON_ID=33651 /ORGANISM="Bicosoecid sp, Strain ms1" /LENGTH=354 /DNA_ID=CAMNT_0050720529 /DNA_START=170 /DNA_END=1230 /DNA_ORIENTATION=-